MARLAGPSAFQYLAAVIPELVPQLVGNDGLRAMRSAIADPDAWAREPKVDGVRGLLVFCVIAYCSLTRG